ncbi:unnamed protein product, partial [Prorocentrum cordatum]
RARCERRARTPRAAPAAPAAAAGGGGRHSVWLEAAPGADRGHAAPRQCAGPGPQEDMLLWDLAGSCRGGDEATLDRYREAEVKHRRVAVLAVVGLVVQHHAHIKCGRAWVLDRGRFGKGSLLGGTRNRF